MSLVAGGGEGEWRIPFLFTTPFQTFGKLWPLWWMRKRDRAGINQQVIKGFMDERQGIEGNILALCNWSVPSAKLNTSSPIFSPVPQATVFSRTKSPQCSPGITPLIMCNFRPTATNIRGRDSCCLQGFYLNDGQAGWGAVSKTFVTQSKRWSTIDSQDRFLMVAEM